TVDPTPWMWKLWSWKSLLSRKNETRPDGTVNTRGANLVFFAVTATSALSREALLFVSEPTRFPMMLTTTRATARRATDLGRRSPGAARSTAIAAVRRTTAVIAAATAIDHEGNDRGAE